MAVIDTVHQLNIDIIYNPLATDSGNQAPFYLGANIERDSEIYIPNGKLVHLAFRIVTAGLDLDDATFDDPNGLEEPVIWTSQPILNLDQRVHGHVLGMMFVNGNQTNEAASFPFQLRFWYGNNKIEAPDPTIILDPEEGPGTASPAHKSRGRSS